MNDRVCRVCGNVIKKYEIEIDNCHEMCFVMVDEKAEREDRI